jgi:hypothetical protein
MSCGGGDDGTPCWMESRNIQYSKGKKKKKKLAVS